MQICGRTFSDNEVHRIREGVLKAYRWQYIISGVQEPRFQKVLGSLINEQQTQRIGEALAPLVQ
jgi:hypothetical protein